MDHVYSASQIVNANSCVWRWWAQYVKGYSPVVPDRRLTIGKLVHAAIQCWLWERNPESWRGVIEGLFRKEWDRIEQSEQIVEPREALEELVETKETALEISRSFIEDQFPWDKWETVEGKNGPMIEYQMVFETASGDTFVMIADWVARHIASGSIFVVDWKTKANIDDPDTEAAQKLDDINVQKAVYQYGLKRVEELDTTGSMIVQICSELPKVPRQNKNGSTARNDIRTTWEVYSATVRERGDNPDEYLDMKEKLSKYKWWAEHRTFRAEHQYNAVWNKVAYPRIVMLNTLRALEGDAEPHRSYGSFHCRSCSMKQLCIQNLYNIPLTEIVGFERREDGESRHEDARNEIEFEVQLIGEAEREDGDLDYDGPTY